jgi:hypothetical protein
LGAKEEATLGGKIEEEQATTAAVERKEAKR